jgi:hypothetical protein
MKTFHCSCKALIFFDNVTCTTCKRELGFLPDLLCLSSLEPAGEGTFRANAAPAENRLYRKCSNYAKESVCNWMVPAGRGQTEEPFCASCRLNQTIPDLSRPQNLRLWALMETAKRRLVYSLMNLQLPIANKTDDPLTGLAFSFLEDQTKPDGTMEKVLTGHENGLITLNIAEADDSVREKVRMEMGEPFRTLLGHFRHEIGHYYWDRLVRDTKSIEPYRKLFGDETMDYPAALKAYYANGAPQDWQNRYITAYASAHPWEDWAETWAHFMHIQDTLETASHFGLAAEDARLDPVRANGASAARKEMSFEETISVWSKLAIALNSVNRSMGVHDAYPFVLSSAAIDKLEFIYGVIREGIPIAQAATVASAAAVPAALLLL